MLSDDEIRRKLLELRHSPVADRLARRAPSINALAIAAGLAPEHLFRIALGQPLGPKSRVQLSRVLSHDTITGERPVAPPAGR